MTEEQKPKVSLASLMTPSKTVSIDYPEFSGMTIDLCFLAREELIKLRSRCLSNKFNRKTRGFEEELDDDEERENPGLNQFLHELHEEWSDPVEPGAYYPPPRQAMHQDVVPMEVD